MFQSFHFVAKMLVIMIVELMYCDKINLSPLSYVLPTTLPLCVFLDLEVVWPT
jgi:hypothetical protein